MKKRILALALAALLCLGLLPGGALAEGPTDAEVLAEGDTEHRVHWTLYADGLLYLKANDQYGSLEKDEYPWREYEDKITSLVIETGNWLNYVPEYLFFDMYSLKTVTVNGSLRNIDASAFRNCYNLTEVTIHGNMGEYEGGLVFWGGIGERAFQNCVGLAYFNVDGVIAGVGEAAFLDCNLSGLDAPVLGDIGASAFEDNNGFSHISPIRGSVGERAFYNDSLHEGNGVYIVSGHSGTLGANAFLYQYSYGGGVEYPALYFTGTQEEFNASYTNNSGTKLTAYRRLGRNVTWNLSDGVLYILGSGDTIDLLDATEQPWLNIPGRTWDENREQITKVVTRPGIELGEHMLDGLEDRVEVRYDQAGTLGTVQWGIYDHVLYISGSGAIPMLYGQEQTAWMPYREEIQKIIIGEGVTTVGFGAFMECPNLTEVSFANSVTAIYGGAFYGCPMLDNVSLPWNLETIGRNAFTGCAGLQRVFIPRTVSSIGSQAFDRSGLTDLFYGGTTEDWAKLGKGEVTGGTTRIDGVSGVNFHPSSYGLPSMAGAEHPHVAACTEPTVCLECGETVEDAVIVHNYWLESDAEGCYYQCVDCGKVLVRLRHYTECIDPEAETCAFCGFPLAEAADYDKGLHVAAYDQVYEEDGALVHECVCMECGETVLEKHTVELAARDEGDADFHSLVCAADGYAVDLEDHDWVPGEDGAELCAACGAVRTVTVTFDANAHGQPSRVVTVAAGQPVEQPEDPTDKDYDFGGWFLEPDCLTPYDFTAPVTEDLVLYAKWTANSPIGGGGGGRTLLYDVRVEEAENGSVTAAPAYAARGRTITLTVSPDEGYQLETITVTEPGGAEVALTEAGGIYFFAMPAADVTVTASFAAIPAPQEACPRDESCPLSAFADLDPAAWYHDGVHFVLESGLMQGYGDGCFGPADVLSRAMLAQLLWNLEGQPAAENAPSFADVAEGAWYAPAVAWAAGAGLFEGYGDGRFGPDDTLTREQLAAVLYRCAQSRGQGFTGMWYFPLSFADAAEVSPWADEALHWLVMNEILLGRTETTLAPQGEVTRAEAATILMRYLALGA